MIQVKVVYLAKKYRIFYVICFRHAVLIRFFSEKFDSITMDFIKIKIVITHTQ
jgi:hypothetical protein